MWLAPAQVRMQATGGKPVSKAVSKISQLIPPAGADVGTKAAQAQKIVTKAIPKVASLYRVSTRGSSAGAT